MSIRLKKKRQLVVALLKRDLLRVKTLVAVRPTSPLELEHALIATEEWVANIEDTLRDCFEDDRKASDVTERLNETIASVRDTGEERTPAFQFRTVVAQIVAMKGRVEKLLKEIDLFVESEGLGPLSPQESSLVNLDLLRALTDAMGRGNRSDPPTAARTRVPSTSARRPAAVRTPEPAAPTPPAPSVFISHSSRDEILAAKIVDLLTASLDPPLARSDIRCTSVAGCTLEGGADTDVRLLGEIRSTPVFLGLITSPSVASDYVLFELGARWAQGANRDLLTLPVLGPTCGYDMLPGPWKNINALRTDKREKVLQLAHETAQALGRALQPAQAWEHAVAALLDAKGGESDSTPTQQATRPKIVPAEDVIDGEDLQRFAECAFSYRAILGQLDRTRDSRIVDAAIRLGELDLGLLKDHERVRGQVQAIFDQAQRLDPKIEVRMAKIERDEEHGCDALRFTTLLAGVQRETSLDFAFLAGPEWGELAALHAALSEAGPGPFRVETGKGEYDALDAFEAVENLEKDGVITDPLS